MMRLLAGAPNGRDPFSDMAFLVKQVERMNTPLAQPQRGRIGGNSRKPLKITPKPGQPNHI